MDNSLTRLEWPGSGQRHGGSWQCSLYHADLIHGEKHLSKGSDMQASAELCHQTLSRHGLHSGILYTYDCSILSIFLAFSFIDIIIQVILINAYMSACMLTFFQVTKLPSFCVFIFWPFRMSLSLFSFMPSLDWRSVAMHPVVSDDWTPFLNSTQ